MKKKICILLCLAILFSMPTNIALAADKISLVVLQDSDFTLDGEPLKNDNDITAERINKVLDSGVVFTERNGYAESIEIDEKHGNSLKIGIDESGDYQQFLSIPIGNFQKAGEDGKLKLEFDYYMSAKAESDEERYSIGFYRGGDKTAVRWGDTYLYDHYNTNKKVEYDVNKWYKATVNLSWESMTNSGKQFNYYTFSVDVERYEDNDTLTSVLSTGDHTINTKTLTDDKKNIQEIRFYFPYEITSSKSVAFDNISLEVEKEAPTITGVEGSVAYNTQSIGVNLSDYVYNLTAEDVELLDEEGNPVDISSANFDSSNKRITINLGEELKPLATHKVVLKTTTEVDIAGTTLSEEKEITFIPTDIINKPIEEDFENVSVSGNDTLNSGVVISKDSGYVKTETADGHGNVLRLGIGQSGEKLPRVDIPLSGVQIEGQSGNAKIEFDFRIGVKPVCTEESIANNWYSEGAFRLGSDETGNLKFLYWHDKMRNNYTNAEFAYDISKWNKVMLDLSWVPNGSNFDYLFSLEVEYSDGGATKKHTYSKSTDSPVTNKLLSTISFFAPKTVSENVWAEIDNIKLSTQKTIPDIRRIEAFDDLVKFGEFDATDTPEDAFIDVDKKNLVAVYLTETISGVDETLVSLKENGIDVEIEKVGYDGGKNAVLLLLTEPLKDNIAYTFTLSEDTEVWSGVPMKVERSASFTTSASGVSVAVSESDITTSGTTATVSAKASNVSDEDKDVYLIVSVWYRDKFIAQSVKKETLSSGETDVSISASVSGVEAGYTVYVYAWNNVFGAEMLTNKIVSKTNN